MTISNSDRRIGGALAQMIQQEPTITNQKLEAMIADLLAHDLTLRAPLRELMLLPSFRMYERHQGHAHARATRDALMSELSSSFQPDLLVRINSVLEGYLSLPDKSTSTAPGFPQSQATPTPIPDQSLRPVSTQVPRPAEPLMHVVGDELPDIAKVSPQMMVRLRRIHALVKQGYKVEKQFGIFPFLRSPTGQTIQPSLWKKGYIRGSWIGFFFPYVICYQIRDYSYFWYTGSLYVVASFLFLATKVDISIAMGITFSIQYALYIPYLRYIASRAGVRPRSLRKSIPLGLLLSIISVIPSMIIESFAPGS